MGVRDVQIQGRDPFSQIFGSVWSKRKSFEKDGPPFEIDHFSQLDRSDRKLTVPFDHSDPFPIPVPHCSVLSMFNMDLSQGSIGLLGSSRNTSSLPTLRDDPNNGCEGDYGSIGVTLTFRSWVVTTGT